MVNGNGPAHWHATIGFLGVESFRQLDPSISLTCDRQQAHDSGSVRQVARWSSGQLWRVVETERVREGKGWMERQGRRQDSGRGDSRSWVGPDGALAINVLSVCMYCTYMTRSSVLPRL
jgi:hypothetical protein